MFMRSPGGRGCGYCGNSLILLTMTITMTRLCQGPFDIDQFILEHI